MCSTTRRLLRRNLCVARAIIVLALFLACAASFRTALVRQIGDDKLSFRSVALAKSVRGSQQAATNARWVQVATR